MKPQLCAAYGLLMLLSCVASWLLAGLDDPPASRGASSFPSGRVLDHGRRACAELCRDQLYRREIQQLGYQEHREQKKTSEFRKRPVMARSPRQLSPSPWRRLLSAVLGLESWQARRLVGLLFPGPPMVAFAHRLRDRDIEYGFAIGRRLPGIEIAELFLFTL